MDIKFSNLDLREQPVLVLKDTAGNAIGTLGYALNVRADIKFNETSVLEFELPAFIDGSPTPHYNDVAGMRVIELIGVGQFILMNPKETNDGVKLVKACKAYSLEYELTYKKIVLEKGTYNFYNPVSPADTLLTIALELLPSWSIGYIDANLYNKYRTFEISGENVYNFLKDTAQKSYGAIFYFDTYNRTINAIDSSNSVPINPVYLSNGNLAKEISVEEDTESIVTRLDVTGADGVDIRDVNPDGTNKIINLDYFVNKGYFDNALATKYKNWKNTIKSNRNTYFQKGVAYALQIMKKTAEEAALKDLEGQLTALENVQATTIQGKAQNLNTDADVTKCKNDVDAKTNEIKAKKAIITSVTNEAANILNSLKAINNAVSYNNTFTVAERIRFDKYIKDDALSESSFVAQSTKAYNENDTFKKLNGERISIVNATVVKTIDTAAKKEIYDIQSGADGRISTPFTNGSIIRATLEKSTDSAKKDFIMSIYLGVGKAGTLDYDSANLTLIGTISNLATNDTSLSFNAAGSLYFTRDTTEYQKRSVAWDLLQFGEEALDKICKPSYKFTIDSANFLCLDDFVSFKNSLKIGQKIYIGIDEQNTLTPICTGVQFNYNAMNELKLEFANSYKAGDTSFALADLLEQSVSMGRSADLSKFNYAEFVNSGANTKVREFMTSALDVAKNAIISTKDQAITWGESGIRLRKWANKATEAYEREELWMSNNSIMMTRNNWNTAELAIGKFKDPNCKNPDGSEYIWGIVAPNIVGTLLAGSSLVIESAKKDGGNTVFRVDGGGCYLYNTQIKAVSGNFNSQIWLDPEHGFVIGNNGLKYDSGTKTFTNAMFYADTNGNLTLTGKIQATSGYIGDEKNGWTITANSLINGDNTFKNNNGNSGNGIYLGTDAIKIRSGDYFIIADNTGKLTANNVDVKGKITTNNITATYGTIGNWTLQNGALFNGKGWFTASEPHGTYLGTNGIAISGGTGYILLDPNGGKLTANNVEVSGKITTGDLSATGGTIGGWSITEESLIKGDPATSGIYLGKNGLTIRNGTNYILAKSNGFLQANNADISGKITATSGEIGGWTIGKALYKDKETFGSGTAGIYLGTNGISLSGINGKIQLSSNGSLYADNANIKGSVNATSGTFNGSVKAVDLIANSKAIGGEEEINGNIQVSANYVYTKPFVIRKYVGTKGVDGKWVYLLWADDKGNLSIAGNLTNISIDSWGSGNNLLVDKRPVLTGIQNDTDGFFEFDTGYFDEYSSDNGDGSGSKGGNKDKKGVTGLDGWETWVPFNKSFSTIPAVSANAVLGSGITGTQGVEIHSIRKNGFYCHLGGTDGPYPIFWIAVAKSNMTDYKPPAKPSKVTS